jgi:hypothetical protein
MKASPGRPATRHSQLIDAMQRSDPRWQKRGFKKAAVGLLNRVNAALAPDDQMPDVVEDLADLMRYIPDLYYVTDDPPVIAICEVECSHAVPAGKRGDIGTIGDMLVEFEIDLRIVVVNAHGSATDIMWEDWHLEMIHSMARESIDDAALACDPAPSGQRVLPRPPPKRGRPSKPARSLDEIIDAAIERRRTSRLRRLAPKHT